MQNIFQPSTKMAQNQKSNMGIQNISQIWYWNGLIIWVVHVELCLSKLKLENLFKYTTIQFEVSSQYFF